jgi:hypothetical protein
MIAKKTTYKFTSVKTLLIVIGIIVAALLTLSSGDLLSMGYPVQHIQEQLVAPNAMAPLSDSAEHLLKLANLVFSKFTN